MVVFTLCDDQTSVHHGLHVPLQRPTIDLGTQLLEILDGQAAVLQDVAEGLGLAVRKSVRFDEHVPTNSLLAALPHLGKLGGQPLDEVFQPTGQVHSALADTLDGPVEGGPVPIVILANREQSFEIISGPVKA